MNHPQNKVISDSTDVDNEAMSPMMGVHAMLSPGLMRSLSSLVKTTATEILS